MDDNEIVRLYLDRNEQALAETAEKYGSYCFTIANNILGSREDSEECVSDTYLRAWNSIPPHKPGILSSFLGKITRNLAFNRYKAARTKKRGGSETGLILDELSEIVSGNDSAEDAVMRREMINAISGFVSSLPREKKYIFIRRYWYSDKISEIADQSGRTENSVNVELNRMRKKLKKYMNERGYEI